MKNNFFNLPITNIKSKPSSKSEVTSQILYGEKFKILSKKKNWIKIKTNFDNYIGYIKKSKYYENFRPTHKICKIKSKVFKKKISSFYQPKIIFFLDPVFHLKISIKTIFNSKKIVG